MMLLAVFCKEITGFVFPDTAYQPCLAAEICYGKHRVAGRAASGAFHLQRLLPFAYICEARLVDKLHRPFGQVQFRKYFIARDKRERIYERVSDS